MPTLRRVFVSLLFASAPLFAAADPTEHSPRPIDRWASAVGGREKVGAIKSIYREATVELTGGMQGTIKAWHTADGKYRKEEQVGSYSTLETGSVPH